MDIEKIPEDSIIYYALRSYIDTLHPFALYPPQCYQEYYLMLGEDSQIKQMSQTIQGVLGSKFTYWNLDYSETEEYKYVEKLLKKIGLDKLVTTASNSLFYGLAPFEILKKYDKDDKKIYIDLIYREPATINKFYFSDKPPYPIKSIEFIGRGVNNRAEKFNVD
ncbi:MAG: hypothetical protein GYA14_11765, partial [Ignavibacteria bacterium]|nr:hypothetical protein [Ignavibacteria bacterium]